eukprot:UC1_evm3s297
MGLNTAFPSSEPAEAAFCVQTAFILYRQLGGSILLYLAVLALNRGRIHWPETKRDGLMIVLQGVSGIWINQFLFLLGLSHTTPNLAAVFQPLCPVVVVLLAVALGFERPTWRKIIGVVFGVGGAFLMAGLSVFQGDASDTAGVFILIAQVIASAVWLLLLKGSYDRYDPLVLTAHQYGWANQHLDATVVGLYGLVQPFATAVINYVVSHATVAAREYYGAATVTVGLGFVLWDQRRRLAAEEEEEEEEEGAARLATNKQAKAAGLSMAAGQIQSNG